METPVEREILTRLDKLEARVHSICRVPIDLEMCQRQIKMIEKTNAATHPIKAYAWDADHEK